MLADYIEKKPVIKTSRLTLRTMNKDDLPNLKEWMPDKELYKYWGKNPGKSDKDPSLLFAKPEKPSKSFHLGIEDNKSGKIIGEIWLYLIENNRMGKLALRIANSCKGNGYATESLKAMVDFAFENTELQRLWSDADVRNIASWRVMEKCGFTREGMIRQGKMVSSWCDYYIYGMLRDDWLRSKTTHNKKVIMFVHGKGGNAAEGNRYKKICQGYDIYGLDYKGNTPWETKDEIIDAYKKLSEEYDSVTIIAYSIGAFFTMNALQEFDVEKALFVSPIVNMEKLISDMMTWANTNESELEEKKEIATDFGETLSWDYLSYVRANPINWEIPTAILYAGQDNLTSRLTINEFVSSSNARLSVMESGEHWFHTEEQLAVLDMWVKRNIYV